MPFWAPSKVERAGLTSVQLSTYFLGRTEILELRERYRRRGPHRFRLKDFHEDRMSIGPLPSRLARENLLEEPRG